MTQPEPFHWKASPDDVAPAYKPETPVAFKVAIWLMAISVVILLILTGMDQQWSSWTVQNRGRLALPHADIDMGILWGCVAVCAVCVLLVALRVGWARWVWIVCLGVGILIRLMMSGFRFDSVVGLDFSIGLMIVIPSVLLFRQSVNDHMARR